MNYRRDRARWNRNQTRPQAPGFLLGVLALLAHLCAPVAGQIVPQGRLTYWRSHTIPERRGTLIRVTGLAANGTSDDAPALQRWINSVSRPAVLIVPAGTYLLRSSLTLPSGVVLSGEGAAKTHFIVETTTDVPAIQMASWGEGPRVPVTGGAVKGSRVITLGATMQVAPGDWVEMEGSNAAFTPTAPDWAQNAVGQIAQVVSVNGANLTLDEPVRLSYPFAAKPTVRRKIMVERAGIEYLHILRRDTRPNANLLLMKQTARCWIRGVNLEGAWKHFVRLEQAAQCVIRDSYLHHGRLFTADHAYGVQCIRHASSNLIENCVFYRLRHAIALEVGSCANVLAYNYSRDMYEADGGENSADISVHGTYAYANLIEGNVVGRISCADAWGPSGPNNVFLRNRIHTINYGQNRWQVHDIDLADHSNGQIVIGNVLPGGAVTIDSTIDRRTLIIHGNQEATGLQWDPTIADRILPRSFYRASAPSFYGTSPWPSIGSDRARSTNPAEQRFLAGAPILDPIPGDYCTTNPDYSQWHFEGGLAGWQTLGTGSTLVWTGENAFFACHGLGWDFRNAPDGVYQAFIARPPTPGGTEIVARIWLPQTRTSLYSVSLFAVENAAGNYAWHAAVRSGVQLRAGWNDLRLLLPLSVQGLNKLGFEVRLRGGGYTDTRFVIDAVDYH